MKTLLESLDYVPVQPGFGTSGVRALVTDLTDLEIYCLTMGTLVYFAVNDLLVVDEQSQDPIKIPVACDLRPSSERLTRATMKAIQNCGYQIEYLGTLPTPALTCYALNQGVASFMITGSHIPLDRNGQKANRCDGEVMKSDEQGIVNEVNKVRDMLLNGEADQSFFDQHGMLNADQNSALPVQSNAAEQHYLQRFASVFPTHALVGLRIVFFEYSAVGRDLLPTILRNAGADVICMGRSDEFFPIDTEALSDQHLHELLQLVLEARAKHGKIDVLVSTDGDSDRPLVIAVEEKTDSSICPRFIPGDLLGLLVTDYLKVDSISVPISSNPAIQQYFGNKNIPVRSTRIGSPYVIDAMQKAKSAGNNSIVAWEANGGYLTGSDLPINTGVVDALPTRDAMLPILCLLHASVQKQQSLCEMLDALPAWYGKAGLLDNFPRSDSSRIVEQLTPAHDSTICVVQFEPERVTMRNVDNQIIAQYPAHSAEASSMINAKRVLETVFSKQNGFGLLTQINCLDGLRCYFDNDDIAHIRPSGNAPQLRIYAYSQTQNRADTIVSLGIEEPAGLVRQMANLTKR
ncbi:MAG: hypothetical protein V3U88_12535 [Methylococcales bacterium]